MAVRSWLERLQRVASTNPVQTRTKDCSKGASLAIGMSPGINHVGEDSFTAASRPRMDQFVVIHELMA